MRIRELMTVDVQTCAPGDLLSRAAEIMWNFDCGCVPVVDAGRRIVGMLTDRDICMAGYLQGRSVAEIPVANVMSKQVHSCGPSDTPATAERIMQEHKVRRLPVVDEDGSLVGIISLGDLAYCMQSQQTMGADGMTWLGVAHTLAAVSAPRRFTPPPSEQPMPPSVGPRKITPFPFSRAG
jgi:CBS domain-containing protein